MTETYGGCANGIPKKLAKLPLVEPTKSFESRDALISSKQKSQGSITNRIIQSDHWSLVAYDESGASKSKRN